MINLRKNLSDGGGVGDHAASSHDLGEITTWDNGRWLEVDSAFKACWHPINKLDGSLFLLGLGQGLD